MTFVQTQVTITTTEIINITINLKVSFCPFIILPSSVICAPITLSLPARLKLWFSDVFQPPKYYLDLFLFSFMPPSLPFVAVRQILQASDFLAKPNFWFGYHLNNLSLLFPLPSPFTVTPLCHYLSPTPFSSTLAC